MLLVCFIRITAPCLSVFVTEFQLRHVRSPVRGCGICLCSHSVVSLAFSYKGRCVPPRTHRIILYSAHKLLPREQQRLFCISARGDVGCFFGGLTSSLSPSSFKILWKQDQSSQEVAAEMHFRAPPPLDLAHAGTHLHELLLKLVWEQCKGGRMTSKHPAEEHGPGPFSSAHTHRCLWTHIIIMYVHNPPLPPNTHAHAEKRCKTGCPEEIFLLLCGAVSQWLVWIQEHSDRIWIWGLRLNVLPKRRRYPSLQWSQLLWSQQS